MTQTGKYVMIAGGIIFLAGLIWYFFGDKLHWLGRLPGDLRFERHDTTIFIPVTTMLIISILLTLILWLIRKITG